ncbi:MAG: UDP-2,4-diacetamido-2,4,6-trideoxy-beta-L-altropyranose hydrolase, partial [Gammaproteobacteria bacterium]|nr:UDP-2,4-diacetamido-2,4,6-trideoxy-beta-L-altropyranose hydrolase [Gammaproteobacteria bacterium]
MKIVFRVDASLQAGHGHVMRCLTLAAGLREQGAECTFICRAHTGHLAELIGHRGFRVHLLPLPKSTSLDTATYADWIGDSWQNDAAQTVSLLENQVIDWLVVDHYGLDARWDSALAKHAERILVIDDLANRPHACQLLLHQTFGRTPADYRGLVKEDCHLLCGSEFALLHRDFKALRASSLVRRQANPFENLLIFMGGSDPDNFSLQILQQLETIPRFHSDKILLILGGGSVWKDTIEDYLDNSALNVELRCNVDNMAQLISEADCAIGASGGSTWERACLGLPMIQLRIAPNQTTIARQLNDNGSIVGIDTPEQLADALDNASKARRKLSLLSASLTDGAGADRVIDA